MSYWLLSPWKIVWLAAGRSVHGSDLKPRNQADGQTGLHQVTLREVGSWAGTFVPLPCYLNARLCRAIVSETRAK